MILGDRMPSRTEERRRFGRIVLDNPLPGHLDEARVRVLEISIVGVRVAHEARLLPQATRALTIDWDGRHIRLTVEVARTMLAKLAKSTAERSVYHSGLRIVRSADGGETLRELVADRIIRALDEQKANARGIPPLAAYMYQPGKSDRYRRCELIDGIWRRSETTRPVQPLHGFTVSADVDPAHIELLCRTYEQTTVEGRRLTKLLAELSLSKEEGVPVRRYEP
jgi:hypothetical protein